EVTEQILGNLADTLTESQRQSAIDQNIDELKKATLVEEYEDILIRPFFHGNQYFMFVTVTYRDVRLVGAPPSSIGKFGADTDNWEWPRHTGDFSLFRIYASQDNLPADYSPSNVPFVPKHYLPISLDGIEEDDFTMVFGFPGRTNEYLPAMAIKQTVEIVDPARIAVREKALDIMDAEMRADPEIKIKYASKFASIANGWKKWIGEIQGLTSTGAFDKKLDYDLEFMRRASQKPEWKEEYATIVPTFRSLYKKMAPFAKAHTYYTEIAGRNVEMLRVAGIFRRLTSVYESSGEPGYQNFSKRVQGFLKGF
ncbi:MAG: S46 family peptidase, partial [Bacteroidota bacterium]